MISQINFTNLITSDFRVTHYFLSFYTLLLKLFVIQYEFCHLDPKIENCFSSAAYYCFSRVLISPKYVESRGNNIPTEVLMIQEDVSHKVTCRAHQNFRVSNMLTELYFSALVFVSSLSIY